ncbi:p10 [Catopsilia pomona nucleopolyhedrovirus]|uniref:p10 n=1 Tax=Catopsilia pomona nucleopolyhedrovirus TaxID=1850906 RepID=A0A172WZ86_9ABAC|nr:p10 [Catopsilia pomona nucleopolyhedrovirus]ANF29668.1 p10 [Catopsilia pomona nucleopolyhedrovirus]
MATKPNALTQIYVAVQDVDAKVEAFQTQVTDVSTKVDALENLPAQLTTLQEVVVDIQSILNGGDLPLPDLPNVPGVRTGSRKSK